MGQRQVRRSPLAQLTRRLEVVGQAVQRVVPGIAAVGHEPLQERQRDRLTAGRFMAPELQHAGHRRDVFEAVFSVRNWPIS